MLKIAWFHFKMYARTFKFVPPAGGYLLLLLLNYSTAPNPILSSFGSTMMLNFIIMSWFTLTFMQSQNKTQQAISAIHLKSKKRFFISSYLCLILLSVLLSAVSVFYPLVTGAFNEPVSAGVVSFSLVNHFIISFLSVCITMLFTKNIVRKRVNGWLGLSLTLVVLLSTAAIAEDSLFYSLTYILPPVSSLIALMSEGVWSFSILYIYAWSAVYSMAFIAAFLFVIKRKDLL